MAINLGQMLQGGANSGSYTPETLARRQKMAEALLGKSMGIQKIEHPLQGLAQMLNAGVGAYRLREAEDQEAAERERANKMMADLLSQGTDADLGALMGASADPWTSDASARMAQILMGENLANRRQQAEWSREDADPMRAIELERAQLELDAMRNPQDDEAPEVKTIFDPETGREVTVQWTGDGPYGGWTPIGGVQAPKDPLVEVNTGDGAPGLGNLSTDYGYVLDPATGKPRIDPETGLPTAAPVPGSPAALEAARLAAAKEAGTDQTERYANVVSEDIDRAVELLKTDPTFSTGPFGQLLGNISGTSANRLDALLSTVRANTSFDRLQAMRAASPTGGALGAVSDTELRLLQNSVGALERSNPDDLEFNLRRVQKIYDDIINGPGAKTTNATQTQDAPKAPEVGVVEDGYRFKGGDPADPNSWEKVQ